MKKRCWVACWGGPALVVAIILVSTLLATLALRELRPCGWLDLALRGDACLCEAVDVAASPLVTSGLVP